MYSLQFLLIFNFSWYCYNAYISEFKWCMFVLHVRRLNLHSPVTMNFNLCCCLSAFIASCFSVQFHPDTELDTNADVPDSAIAGKQTELISRNFELSKYSLACDIRNVRHLLRLILLRIKVALKLNAVEQWVIYYPSSIKTIILFLCQQSHSTARLLYSIQQYA